MLTQAEADGLIAMPKERARDENYNFPQPGAILTIPIISANKRDTFLIDVNRGKIRLTKCSYQERYRVTVVLLRLDIDGSPHPNPEVQTVPVSYLTPYNGVIIPCPHIHLYVEGFMDKWAIPAPLEKFPRTDDLYLTFMDFLKYCNVIKPPLIQRRLF